MAFLEWLRVPWVALRTHWPAAAVVGVTVLLLLSFVRRRRLSVWGQGGAMIMGLAGAYAMALLYRPGPQDGWSSFFGSFLQGYSAMLGIVVAGVLVGLQLVLQEYGPEVSKGVLGRNRDGKIALALLIGVVLLASWGLTMSPANHLTPLLAAMVFLCGIAALPFAVVAVEGIVADLGPGQVVAFLTRRLASSSGRHHDLYDETTWQFATLLGRYAAKGPGPWGEVLVAYRMEFLRLLRECSSGEEKPRLAQAVLRPLHLLDIGDERRPALVKHMRVMMRSSWSSYSVAWYIYDTARSVCPSEAIKQFRSVVHTSLECVITEADDHEHSAKRLAQFFCLLYAAGRAVDAGSPARMLFQLVHGINTTDQNMKAFLTALSFPAYGSQETFVAQLAERLGLGIESVKGIWVDCRTAIEKLPGISSSSTVFPDDDEL